MAAEAPPLSALIVAAREAASRGDRGGALAIAEQAAALDPRAPAPWFLLGALLLDARDRRAGALLPRLEAFPEYAPGWEEIGRALLAAGQADAAHVAFAKAVAHGGARIGGHLGRAAALEACGRHREAAAALAAAEALLPDSWEIPYRRGLSLRRAGALEAARDAFEAAVGRPDAGADAAFALGLVRQDLGEHAGAVAAYRAALAARQDYHEAALNLGTALQACGRWEEAVDAYALAYRLKPEAFGRIAQSVVSARCGRLFLDPGALRALLVSRS